MGGWVQSSIKCVKVIPLSVLEIPLRGLPGTSHHFLLRSFYLMVRFSNLSATTLKESLFIFYHNYIPLRLENLILLYYVG